MYGLGRIESVDERDKKYHLRALLPPPKIDKKYWNDVSWWGNQGVMPHCVGFSFAKWIEDAPVTHRGAAPYIAPIDIYNEAQKIDPWAGTEHDGTDVRSAAKYLKDIGVIESYLWAWDIQTMINCVLTTAPVVIGINWYDKMFYPNAEGMIHLKGRLAGGHAIVVNGVNTINKTFRLANSWGKEWGLNGHCNISFKDMERLIKEDGEILLGIENKKHGQQGKKRLS